MKSDNPKIKIRDLTVLYGSKCALSGISMDIQANLVTSIIGPSGCGKTTFLKCLNRMNDIIPNTKISGSVHLDGQDIYDKDIEVSVLRRRVGMVFQESQPFPKSIFENVAFGLRINGWSNAYSIEKKVKESLEAVALWDEVKNHLMDFPHELSAGQQQRLCIARALAIEPEVILMDEPASSLDPVATARIERLLRNLIEQFTIVIVTHNMQQAARVSDQTALFDQGNLIEFDETQSFFTNPRLKETEDYITGKFR